MSHEAGRCPGMRQGDAQPRENLVIAEREWDNRTFRWGNVCLSAEVIAQSVEAVGKKMLPTIAAAAAA